MEDAFGALMRVFRDLLGMKGRERGSGGTKGEDEGKGEG